MGWREVLRRVRIALEPNLPPKVSVYVLIANSQARFAQAVDEHAPTCPTCHATKDVHVDMLFRWSNLSRYGHPFREDQCWKCPRCYLTVNHGIPMTEAEWTRAKELRGGYLLMRPDLRFDEQDDPEVLARLRALGYIE